MKRLQFLAVLTLTACILAGCTDYAELYDQNTFVVNKKGKVIEISVEDFKDSSVDANSLTSYVTDQVDTYNGEDGEKIKMESINTEDMGHVKLVLSYDDLESYNAFNLLNYSLMDISEIQESDLTGSFTSAEDIKTSPADIIAEEKCKVLTVSEATDVIVKGEILYYNDEVTVHDGVATTSGKKNAIIVFK